MSLPKRIKLKLSKHDLLQLAIKTARVDGFLQISIDAMEKWNFDGTDQPVLGHFDVEGHSCCDVRARVLTPFFSFGFWKNAAWPWLKEAVRSRHLDELVINLKYHPFNKYFDGWLWIVDSFKIARGSYAEEIVDLTMPELVSNFNNYKERNEEISKAEVNITDSQLRAHLRTTGHQINDSVFINENDPTCMTVNENLRHKFDLKDGWSGESVCCIIRDWWRYTDLCLTKIVIKDSLV